ncbi:hypothetical protein BV20DRAFT_789570 [Pilatotrama ljubarskyi]|nr:hypothetical protein BV20DRAFT_789570 [Pilatotrama ljubarskyi]
MGLETVPQLARYERLSGLRDDHICRGLLPTLTGRGADQCRGAFHAYMAHFDDCPLWGRCTRRWRFLHIYKPMRASLKRPNILRPTGGSLTAIIPTQPPGQSHLTTSTPLSNATPILVPLRTHGASLLPGVSIRRLPSQVLTAVATPTHAERSIAVPISSSRTGSCPSGVSSASSTNSKCASNPPAARESSVSRKRRFSSSGFLLVSPVPSADHLLNRQL